MEPFVRHAGTMALLDWADVNTDLIIPARYLKRVERTGFGPLLFADKRYEPGTEPPADDPGAPTRPAADFPLNRPGAAGASILVVGRNFGCGSSREHAVWAVAQAGFRALIAPGRGEGFADIFEGNAYQNGLLPIELPADDWARVAGAAEGGASAEVDLEARSIEVRPAGGPAFSVAFEVEEAHRARLLRGLDAVGETLIDADAIAAFEAAMPAWLTPHRG